MNDRKISTEELKFTIVDFLKERKYGTLATSMNNIPRSSPVQYFVGQNMNIYIISVGGEKFKAIAENENVCLLVSDQFISHRKIKGVQVFGTAKTSLMDNKIYEELKLHNIYNEIKNGLNVIKIIPEEIVYLNSVEDGDRTKQILRYNNVLIKKEKDPIYLVK